MTVLAVAATILAVWLGAWIAGLDLTIGRDYFSVAVVSVLMPIWRFPLAFWAIQVFESWNPIFFWLVFTGLAWVIHFWLITFVAGKALGGSLKQSSIVSATVIGINIFVSYAIPMVFG